MCSRSVPQITSSIRLASRSLRESPVSFAFGEPVRPVTTLTKARPGESWRSAPKHAEGSVGLDLRRRLVILRVGSKGEVRNVLVRFIRDCDLRFLHCDANC